MAQEWNDCILVKDDRFIDSHGRTLLCRGVNMSGCSKLPTGPGNAWHHKDPGFYNYRHVSFIGRPFKLHEVDDHFSRLHKWGLTFARLLVTWEALEHEGPGIYDEDYISYLLEVIRKAPAHGIKVFIDPHQDTWSRFSGGSGAPGWTFEAAGLNPKHFVETGAVAFHDFHNEGDRSMIWPTNYIKLASATMFTLFFGGDIFAPKTTYQEQPIQQFLQRHFVNAYTHLAQKIKEAGLESHVVGFEVMNEPHPGYIGQKTLEGFDPLKDLHLSCAPSPIQSFALASGMPQNIDIWVKSWPYPSRKSRKVLLNQSKISAWLPGRPCIWRDHGLWDINEKTGEPVVLKHDYFTKFPGNESIHTVLSKAAIFFEPIPNEDPPDLLNDASKWNDPYLVYAPHWYDLKSIFSKSFNGYLTHDVQGLSKGRKNILQASYFGLTGARRNYSGQVQTVVRRGKGLLGPRPCLFGECGIPMDMNDRSAFVTGDFTHHNNFLDAVISAMESNLVNFTLWNYNPHNDHYYGDYWNGEDFSIFSTSIAPKSSKSRSRTHSTSKDRKYSDYSVVRRQSRDKESNPKRKPSDPSTKSGQLNGKPHALNVTTLLAESTLTASPSSNTSMSMSPATPFDISAFAFEDDAEMECEAHHKGGRALDAVIRPYASKIPGIPTHMRFDLWDRTFEFKFSRQKLKHERISPSVKNSQNGDDPFGFDLTFTTEIFIPHFHYADLSEYSIEVSDGVWTYIPEKQSLYWMMDPSFVSEEHSITITPCKQQIPTSNENLHQSHGSLPGTRFSRTTSVSRMSKYYRTCEIL